MQYKKYITTILFRLAIIAVNFLLVVMQARLWGSEGRGNIALVITDVSMVIMVSNIFCGSSLAYYLPKYASGLVLAPAFIGGFLLSVLGSIIILFVHNNQFPLVTILLSVLLSFNTIVAMYFLGKNLIFRYNMVSAFAPFLTLVFISVLYFAAEYNSVNVYFYSYVLSLVVVLSVVMFFIYKNAETSFIIDKNISKGIFMYGMRNEIHGILQLLNYRIAFYFVAYKIGIAALGVFSIAVSVAEAIWIISRSISTVQYADIINSDNKKHNIFTTNRAALLSLSGSLILVVVLILLPGKVYQFIFGEEFTGIKEYLLLLSPGILFIALSNVYAHYFSASGKQIILIIKSAAGFITVVGLLWALTGTFMVKGVIMSINVSYFVSSLILFVMFLKEKKSIRQLQTHPS